MNIRELLPAAGEPCELGTPAATQQLEDWYRSPAERWVRVNFVASLNGNASGSDGTSATLSVGADRKILGAIRRAADVVLVGASTMRSEGHLLPRAAPLAIVTGSGNLTGAHIPDDVADDRVLVLCPEEAVARVKSSVPSAVTVLALSTDEQRSDAALSPEAIVAALHSRGLTRIVCEGGPRLAAQFVNSGIVDELCITTSPQLNGSERPLFPGLTSIRNATLSQLLVDSAGALYARWLL